MSAPASRLLAADVVAALDLPPQARVAIKLAKATLNEKGARNAAQRKLVQEHVAEAHWLAALRPGNVGVPEYRDARREYLEVAVVSVALRRMEGAAGKAAQLAALLHRAVPYPLLLLLDDGACLRLSLAHLRWAQNEAGKTVLDGDLVQAVFGSAGGPEGQGDFLAAMALGRQPQQDMQALYQGWMDTVSAWECAAVVGHFAPSATPEQAAARRAALLECQDLDAQIARLRAAAGKERQMARQVAANLEIRALQERRQQLAEVL